MDFNALKSRLKAIKPMHWLILFIFVCVAATLIIKESPKVVSSAEEDKISAILSAIEGAGETRIAVYYQSPEAADAFSKAPAAVPKGAVIVSESAGDIFVRLNLIRATRALLGLKEDAVEVFSMTQGIKKE